MNINVSQGQWPSVNKQDYYQRRLLHRHIRRSIFVFAGLTVLILVILRLAVINYYYGPQGVNQYLTETKQRITELKQQGNQQAMQFADSIDNVNTGVITHIKATIAAVDSVNQQARSVLLSAPEAVGQTISVAASTVAKPIIILSTGADTTKPADSAQVQTASETAAPTQSQAQTQTANLQQPTMMPADTSNSIPPGANQVQFDKGKYSYGQCTYYVASRRPVPPNWGNARDWMANAKASGYFTGSIPVAGAIAWTSAGRYGHVAYVEQVKGDDVLVSEMNYIGWNRISQRWVKANSFGGYIYDHP